MVNKGWNYKRKNNFSQEPLLQKDRINSTDLSDTNKREKIFINEPVHYYLNEPKIKLNISGSRMEICEKLLDKYPDTLLGSKSLRILHYDKYKDEYFYDRSPSAFEGILYFYQSNGRFILPSFVHVEIFYEEIKYFKLVDYLTDDPKCDESILSVAFEDLHSKIEDDINLSEAQQRRKLTELKRKYHRINMFSEDYDDEDENELDKLKIQQELFILLERPNRSRLGKLLAFVFLAFVIISIVVMCAETVLITDIKNSTKLKSAIDYLILDDGEIKNSTTLNLEQNKRIFFILEFLCNLVFSIELILRFISTGKKMDFLKRFPNIIDIISVLPFWLTFSLQLFMSLQLIDMSEKSTINYLSNLYILRILRLTRVLRILKLTRHVKALNIIGKIFVECIYEITLLMTFFAMNIIVFSSLMYYIEYQVIGSKDTPFKSIPETFWWAIISFTTVGYGDLIPISGIGKASCCIFILFGLLIAVLPSPILSIKFERFYKQLAIIDNLKKKKNKPQINQSN